MHFNKLDLNLLVALDALLTERSVSRAAQRLHLSPSALSNSLMRLREYFGDDLLVQIGRKMEMTPRAELLKDAVRDVLLRIESTIATQPAYVPQTSDRVFRVFSSEYTQLVFAAHLSSAMAVQGANVRVQWLPQVINPHLQLERGEADFLIIPTIFASKEHPHEVLYEEDFVCVVCKDGYFGRRGISADDYKNAWHVVMRPGDGHNQAYESLFFQEQGIQRQVAMTTYSFAALPALVVGTPYIATVHARLAQYFARAWNLAIWPMPLPFSKLQQCVQWHQYRSQDPALIWLREQMHTAVLGMDGKI